MAKKSPWEVRDPLPRTLPGWWYLIREHTACRWGWHSRPKRRVYKFNGGNGAWLCRACYLILKYGHER